MTSSRAKLSALRDYGTLDPIRDAPRFTAHCRCGRLPGVHYGLPSAAQVPGAQNARGQERGSQRARYYVECNQCGVKGRACRQVWQAVIEWNKSPCAIPGDLETFPFFNLKGLSFDQIKHRLAEVRSDLESRRQQAKDKRAMGLGSGKGYQERLDAYLGWLTCAQSWLKASVKHG